MSPAINPESIDDINRQIQRYLLVLLFTAYVTADGVFAILAGVRAANRIGYPVMMNVGDPDHAFSVSRLPNDGVGLARLEFIINNHIGIHPMALVNYPNLKKRADIETIANRILEEDPKEFFVRSLAEGIGRIAAQLRGGLLLVWHDA